MQPTSLAVTSTAARADARYAPAAPALTLAADTRSVILLESAGARCARANCWDVWWTCHSVLFPISVVPVATFLRPVRSRPAVRRASCDVRTACGRRADKVGCRRWVVGRRWCAGLLGFGGIVSAWVCRLLRSGRLLAEAGLRCAVGVARERVLELPRVLRSFAEAP
jgi:pyruvate-formate lyase-activating enzyme